MLLLVRESLRHTLATMGAILQAGVVMEQTQELRSNQYLSMDDLAMFAKIGVPPDLLEEAHVRRVSDLEAREVYGIAPKTLTAADMAGVVFPYSDPITGHRTTARIRRDHPEHKPDGRPENKFVSAYGDNRHLYFPPGSGDLLQ